MSAINMVRMLCLRLFFVHATNAAANTDADISTMVYPPPPAIRPSLQKQDKQGCIIYYLVFPPCH